MITHRLLPVVMATVALAGCHATSPASNTELSDANQSARAEPAAANGTARCPASTPASTPDQPVADVAGLRPGMPVADVEVTLRCRNNIAEIVDGGQFYMPNPPGLELRQELLASSGSPCIDGMESNSDNPGGLPCQTLGVEGSGSFRNRDDIFMVGLVGLPGAEHAEGIWRTQKFADGQRPALSDLSMQLKQKYGEPNHEENWGGSVDLRWVYDLRGRIMSEANPSYGNCGGIRADRQSGQQFAEQCGITIAAEIVPDSSNPELVRELRIGTADPAAFSHGITAVQEHIAAQKEQERKRQVEQARKNAAPVEL